MKALLEQYKSTDSAVIKQIDISFINHSLERLDDYERAQLIPIALRGCCREVSQPRPGSFGRIMLRLLLDLRLPPRGSKDDEAFREVIGLSDTNDATYLAVMIGHFLRLKLPVRGLNWYESNPTIDPRLVDNFVVEDPAAHRIYQRLLELKKKLVAFLGSGAFTDYEKFIPVIYAASNFDSSIAAAGEEVLKRTSISLEDPNTVVRLTTEHKTLPVPYRIRILGLLSKSALSTRVPPYVRDVVEINVPLAEHNGSRPQALEPASALEATKLHKALFQYLAWVAKMGPLQGPLTISDWIINKMKAFIEFQGWPSVFEPSEDTSVLRSKAYETIGMFAQQGSDMAPDKMIELASWLLISLTEDKCAEAVVSIDGALSNVVANTPPMVDEQNARLLRSIVLSFILPNENTVPHLGTIHGAVKLANKCLPFSDVVARYIDVLAIGSDRINRSDVVEQGQKGLDPWTYHDAASNIPRSAFPCWRVMIVVFLASGIENAQILHPESLDPSHLEGGEVLKNFQHGDEGAVSIALRYIKLVLYLSALDDFKLEPNWMDKLEAQINTDMSARNRIREYLRSVDSQYWVYYLKSCLDVALNGIPATKELALRCFVELASICPADDLANLTAYSTRLTKLVQSNEKEIRYLSARAYAILGAHPSLDDAAVTSQRQLVEGMFANAGKAFGSDLNAAEGGLLAFSYHCSRSVFYGRAAPAGQDYPLRFLFSSSTPQSLQQIAFDAFGQLWSAGLAIPPATGEHSVEKVVDQLTSLAKKGDEKAISALGRLAAGLNDDDVNGDGHCATEVLSRGVLGKILKELFALHEIKRTEVHFSVGDALSAAVARWDSSFVQLTMDVEVHETFELKGVRAPVIKATLDKLFTDCKGTKPSLLKASGIWLFCIIQYCSGLPEVQSRLREAQAAFMRLLSARDELVQETASRGLSLVYERGDEDLKSTLVKDLVAAFTGTGTQLKVEQDTELFEPGALPTGEGSSVTSYKDIVNLANEVGDQRLVYKFMSLASNAATWSTRSAFGRFGLSSILGDSEVDPKLYPKLYRYRFDPNQNVRRSMDDIWKALVKDSSRVLDEHFDDILNDLMDSILGREWRMREASCAAISDLLQSHPFAKYENRYRDIWNSALKVLDDVKGSVRQAALRLCMTLSKNLVHQLAESHNTSAAKAMMKEALPFLLSDKGAESSVEDVKIFSTITVLDIAKKGGVALRPFIPDMVPQLLGLLSTIEPEQINYQYQRAGDDSRDQIDRIRAQMVNRSPISEAVENCLRFVNADVMAQLAPKLEETIKSAIGMPTKLGCSRVLSILFTSHTADAKPFCAKFLKIVEKQAMDKNDEVSQAYARAAAYIMRGTPPELRLTFCRGLVSKYLGSEEESRRQKIADIVVSLAKVSPDHFTANETTLLPFAYLGMHDTDEYTNKVFKTVWDQHAGSSRTVVRYVQEIVSLVEKCLETTQWALRHTGAFTVGAMVSDVASASEATGQIGDTNLRVMWPILDKVLALKTFAGKEKVLESYPRFVEKADALWRNDSQVAAQMKKIAIREAKRNNDAYRVHAFKCLWQFAKARDDLDMLEEIAGIVTPHLDTYKDEDENAMDVDGKNDHISATAQNGFEAIARGYNRPQMEKNPRPVLELVAKLSGPYLSSVKFGAIKRDVWYDAVCEMMKPFESATSQDQAPISLDKDIDGLSLKYLNSLDVDQAESGVESQRIRRAAAVSAVAKGRMAGAFGVDGPSLGEFVEVTQRAVSLERAMRPRQAMSEAADALQAAIARQDLDRMSP